MEDREIKEMTAKDGSAVNTMINSRGWTQVVRPALVERIKFLHAEFSNATEYEQFVRIQQSINAINSILDFIEITLAEGKDAIRELKESV